MICIKKIIKKFIRFPYIATIQSLRWRFRLKFLGKKVIIGKNISINNPSLLSIGNNVFIGDNVSFHLSSYCSNSEMGGGVIIEDNVFINKYCDFGSSNKIILEHDCMLAPYVHITDRNHRYEDIEKSIKNQGSYSSGPVIIGAETWIGFMAQILSNVKIGKHCIIGAGAIVTHDIPDYSVAVGNPAKIIKKYNFEKKSWEKV